MPGLAPGPPRMALQQDLKLKDEKVLPCTLPVPLKRLAERSAKVKCGHREPGGKIEPPTCTFQRLDNKALSSALAKAESDKHLDPNLLNVHPLPSLLPSVKTAESAQFQPPRPSGNSAVLVPV